MLCKNLTSYVLLFYVINVAIFGLILIIYLSFQDNFYIDEENIYESFEVQNCLINLYF